MGREVPRPGVVDVAADHQPQAQVIGQVGQGTVCGPVPREARPLQLQVEATGEDGGVAPGGRLGLGQAPRQDEGRHLPAPAGGEGDEPLAMGGQGLHAGPGRTPGVPQVGLREEAAEAGVTPWPLRQEDQVVPPLQGDFRPLDGAYTDPLRLFLKEDGPGHVVVVGEGQGGHLQFGRPGYQGGDGTGPVQEGEAAVDVQMHKGQGQASPQSQTL